MWSSSAARGLLAIWDGDVQQQKELSMNRENYEQHFHGLGFGGIVGHSSEWFLPKHGDAILPHIRSIAALAVAAGS